MRARMQGIYQGSRVFCFDVRVTHSALMTGTREIYRAEVIARNASDALWSIRDNPEFLTILCALLEPIEVETYGTKGGKKSHFLGWNSVIGTLMYTNPRARQLTLFGERL